MNKQRDTHLQDEQLVLAIVDEKELADEVKDHLQECKVCQEKVAHFAGGLELLGQRAELSVPPLARNMRLPQEAKPAARFRLGWVSFAGGAALAGLLLFFYFIGMNARTPDLAMVQDQDNLFEDENFMQEISDIVDSPFPEDIYEITGDAVDSEDDFLQFVVPDPQEELQS